MSACEPAFDLQPSATPCAPKHIGQLTIRSRSNSRYSSPYRFRPQGVVGYKSRVSILDVSLMVIEILCVIAATLAVFLSQAAVWLGQVHQLIVVGFLLAVMGLCTESIVLRTVINHLGVRSKTTIQDVDAALRKDLLASNVHFSIRFIILTLMCLPLGLSAAYKEFIGGSTEIVIDCGLGFFGFSSLPGHQRIGNGLSLVPEVYVPFWIDPGLNRTYGYNLYISDNETAVIVDSPFPAYLTSLQSNLKDGEMVKLSATVNATVSELRNPTPDERANETYWEHFFAANPPSIAGGILGAFTGLGWGIWSSGQNYTEAFFASFNTTRDETFVSTFNRVVQTRRMAKAEWLITRSNITLTGASLVNNSMTSDQSLIHNTTLGLQDMFVQFLDEYQVAGRDGVFDQPYPGPVGAPYHYHLSVNTIPALAASIIWSRITSLDTIDRPQGIQDPHLRALSGYDKSPEDIVTVRCIPSLKRSSLLLLVFLTHPLLCAACISFKALCHRSPLGDSFNVIALLSAASNSDLRLLKGAVLTGKLARKVYVMFRGRTDCETNINDAGLDATRLELYLDKPNDESYEMLDQGFGKGTTD